MLCICLYFFNVMFMLCYIFRCLLRVDYLCFYLLLFLNIYIFIYLMNSMELKYMHACFYICEIICIQSVLLKIIYCLYFVLTVPKYILSNIIIQIQTSNLMRSQPQPQRPFKDPKDGISPLSQLKPPTISNVCSIAVLLIGTFLVCLIIILNVFIDMPLFIMGVNFAYSFQQAVPYGYMQVLQNILSLFCHPMAVGAVLVIYYIVVNRKLLLIVHLSYLLFTTYIIALLKQAFQQSRPIWYDHRIVSYEWFCWKDFGNPSGHSFAVILLYEPIISDSIGYWKYRPWDWLLIFLCVLVPLSRVYLGVHSVNQVLFGLSLGTVFLILYKYIYQKALYELYWQFLLGSTKCKKFIKFLGIIALNLVVIAIPIIFYLVNVTQRPMNPKDLTNLNAKCSISMTGQQVQQAMLIACSIGCFAFGLIYGFILLSNQPRYRKYLLGLWAYESYLKVIMKIGIYIVCAGVPFIFFYLFAHFLIKDVFGRYVMYCLAMMGAGLGLSYLAPKLTSFCNIMKLLPGSAEDYEHKYEQIHENVL